MTKPDMELMPEIPELLDSDVLSADLLDVEDGQEGVAPEAPARELLRRVRINAYHLARASSIFAAFAARHGYTEAERDEVTLFVREQDLLLAMDLDVAGTRTADGRARPMRLRYRLPVEPLEGGMANFAGARLRLEDLRVALRNRITNSQNFGVLAVTDPAVLEVYASLDGTFPEQFIVHPSGKAVLTPREFTSLRGAVPEEFEALEPHTTVQGLQDLDPEALIECATVSHPDVGVLLDPRDAGRGAGYLAAVGERGLMLSTFASPYAVDTADLGLAAADEEATAPVVEEGEPSLLDEPAVLSPRFATSLGFVQGAYEDALRAQQKLARDQHISHVVSAAIAATLEVQPDATGTLYTLIGAPVVAKASAAAQKAKTPADAAVAFAKHVLGAVPTADADLLVHQFESAFAAAGQSTPVPESTVQAIRAATDGNATLAALATLSAGYQPTAEAFATVATRAAGEAQLRVTARKLIAHASDVQAVETLRFADLAAAAVRLKGTKSDAVTDALLPSVPSEARSAWWDAFAIHLAGFDVPANAIEELLAQQGTAPTTKRLALSSAVRDAWMATAPLPAQGHLWRDGDGRVHAGFGDDEVGLLSLSDLAVMPEPAAYPIQPAEIRQALARGETPAWRGQFYSTDLRTASLRVVGLASQDREAREDTPRNRMAPDGSRSETDTVFVLRWTPPMHVDGPEGRVLQFARPEQRQVVSSKAVIIGEGAAARTYEEERGPKELPIADPAVAGDIRVFGFYAGGERLHMTLPLKAVLGARPPAPIAFALDGRQGLHDFITFVTRNGTQAVLEVEDGRVRLSTVDGSRVVVLPTVTATDVPATLRPVLQAAGVPAAATPIALEDIFARVRALGLTITTDRPALADGGVLPAERPAVPGAIRWRNALRNDHRVVADLAESPESDAEDIAAERSENVVPVPGFEMPLWSAAGIRELTLIESQFRHLTQQIRQLEAELQGPITVIPRRDKREALRREQLDAFGYIETPVDSPVVEDVTPAKRNAASVAKKRWKITKRLEELRTEREKVITLSDAAPVAGVRRGLHRASLIVQEVEDEQQAESIEPVMPSVLFDEPADEERVVRRRPATSLTPR